MDPASDEAKWMRRAVTLGKESLSEDRGKPKVGVVVVRDGEVLGESYRGRTGRGEHAEYGLLRELEERGVTTKGATVYTTLEPCSSRNHPKVPCAKHLINADVARVFIGMYDPNPRIYRAGWRLLRDAKIALFDFPLELRDEIARDNADFVGQFRGAEGRQGQTKCFDYKQNDGRFTITDDDVKFELQVSERGPDSVYLLDYANKIGQPRHVAEFKEIDDPGAVDDWTHYTKGVAVGQIGMMRTDRAYLLIKVTCVDNMDRGDDQWRVCFDYEIRQRSES